jgi:hypothetical protein
LSSTIDFLPGMRLETRLQIGDWTDFDALLAQIIAGIESGRPVAHPVTVLGLVDSPALQLEAARIWMKRVCPANDFLGTIPRRVRTDKLRIGYFFRVARDHPTPASFAELIETHDRSRFEVFGFSLGTESDDHARRRLSAAFDEFTDVATASDRDVATLARRIELDIAIDLGGCAHNGRPGIFALRAAPIQVSYLSHPGTLGTCSIDYMVADATVVTPESEARFTEKIAYLPDTCVVDDQKRQIAARFFSRSELGLPPVGFVFCCFDAGNKMLPCPSRFCSSPRVTQHSKPTSARTQHVIASIPAALSSRADYRRINISLVIGQPICSWTRCPTMRAPRRGMRCGRAYPFSPWQASPSLVD